jgi:acetyl esterase
MQEVIDQLATFNAPRLETLSAENARNLPTMTDAMRLVVGKHWLKRAIPFPEAVTKIEHRTIPTPNGKLLARVYHPLFAGSEAPPLPVLLYFHGGGWVLASLDTYDASCRALCNASQFIVVSLAYRQAPEYPFPAAVDDAFDAYRWITENAKSFGGDSEQVAVGGESAGGNLAAVTCLRARDEGARPPIHQLLIYPSTDFAFHTDSFMEFADAKPLSEMMMFWFRARYLRNEQDRDNPYASPLRAKSLRGLPSATIITAEVDPLCSDGELYASRLLEEGVPVSRQRYNGVTHEFFGMKALLQEARDATELAGLDLKDALDRETVGDFSIAV